jgi:uncharacterized membrane protein
MRDRYPDGFEGGWHPFWVELFGWLLLLLVLAAVIGVAVWAAMRLGGRRGTMTTSYGGATGAWSPEWSRPPGPDQALQAVRLRYAQGEITREEYARLVADLGGQVPGPPPAQGPPPAPPPGQAPPPAAPPTQQL